MAVTAVNCRCGIACPGSAHCIAMWVYDEHACYVDCSEPVVVEVGPAILKHVPLDGQVQIDVAAEVTLAELGEFLDRHCEVELLIPASDASRKIEFSEEYITMRALIDRTGLVMRDQDAPQA